MADPTPRKSAEIKKPQPKKAAVTRSSGRKTAVKRTAVKRSAVKATAAQKAAEPRLRVVQDVPGQTAVPEPVLSAGGAAAQGSRGGSGGGSAGALGLLPDIQSLVSMLVGVLRAGGAAAGLSGDDLERRVALALAYLRRRLAGDYVVDDFGFDKDFTENVWLPLLRPLYRKWFRVEVRGIENLPATGRALVVANHSGTIPVDGLMTQIAIHDEHPAHRFVRMLGADLVFQSPFVGEVSRKAGTTLASNLDAEQLLGNDELVAVFPEGFKGVGKPFSDRYRLQRFGRGGFVGAALRTGSPIIPCSIVGAEEIYPLLGNAKSLARVLGFPYFPLTPFFPWLGPLGMIPLPSKWIIEFGEPVPTDRMDPASADDPMVLFELTDQVRESIQHTLHSLLLQRRSVFF